MSLARQRLEALALLLMVATLAAYLWTSRGRTTTADHEGRQAHLLPVFEQAAVRKIVIEQGAVDQGAIVLSRNAKGSDPHDYMLGEAQAPDQIAPSADRAEVASLLKTLEFATFLRLLAQDDAADSAPDLDSPLLTLKVEMDSVNYRVAIGSKASHPPGTRYARTTGDDGTDRRGVVPESLVEALSKDARQLRGRLLFPYAKSQTKALRIERKQGGTSLLADPLGFLVSETPERVKAARANPARIDALFFQLARAGMEAYPKGQTKPDEPTVVTQVPESGPEVRLEVGGDCPGHPDLVQVVRTAPDALVGCTNRVLLDVLEPRDLSLRGLWSLDPDEIDHLVVTKAGKTMELIRDGAAFRRLSPDPGPIGLERGNEYLEDLTDFVFDEAPCAGEASGQVRVVGQPEGSTGGRELRLTLLDNAGTLLARREDDGACLALTDHASWLLDPTASWYESLEVLSVQAKDVLSLVSAGPDFGREELHRVEGALELRGGAVDEGLLDETLRTLSPLRADRIAPPWSASPWQARLEIRIEAKSTGPFTLRIGPRVRGGYLAALGGRRTEFVLSPDVVRTLERSLFSRAPAQWNPSAFTELAVSAHGVTYTFRRIGDELVPIDDSPRELGPALVEALSGLVPSAAVRAAGRPAAPLAPTEGLNLVGMYDAGDGRPRRLTVALGAQVLHDDRPAQLMTIDQDKRAYYVDRAAVLSVLDLL